VPRKPRRKNTNKPDASIQALRSSQPEPGDPTQLTWAQRLKRAFEFAVTVCPLCGGTLRVIADITAPAIIDQIINPMRRSRAPPGHAQRRPTSTDSVQHNNRSA